MALQQLKLLGLAQFDMINMNSDFFKEVTDMYNEMGDIISLQYGGSIAHHSQLAKKKGFMAGVSEMVTSLKRHIANNFSDSQR